MISSHHFIESAGKQDLQLVYLTNHVFRFHAWRNGFLEQNTGGHAVNIKLIAIACHACIFFGENWQQKREKCLHKSNFRSVHVHYCVLQVQCSSKLWRPNKKIRVTDQLTLFSSTGYCKHSYKKKYINLCYNSNCRHTKCQRTSSS